MRTRFCLRSQQPVKVLAKSRGVRRVVLHLLTFERSVGSFSLGRPRRTGLGEQTGRFPLAVCRRFDSETWELSVSAALREHGSVLPKLLAVGCELSARINSLECAVAKKRLRKSFRMRSSEKRWG